MRHTYKSFISVVPDMLSVSRLLLLPVLGYFALMGESRSFGYLLVVYALTDTLDGNIARYFNVVTDRGAKLDSVADDTGNLFMIVFCYLLFPFVFEMYSFQVALIVCLFVVAQLLKVVKLKNIGLHLYSGKISQATFLVMLAYLAIFSFSEILFYLWFAVSLFHFVEILIALTFFKPDGETKHIIELIKRRS